MQYTYHYFIVEKPIQSDYSASTNKIGTNSRAPKFKVKYKNIWSKDKFIIYSVLKTNIELTKLKI